MLNRTRLLFKTVFGDVLYESIIFYIKNRYWPNFENPATFNEIISFNKLNLKDKKYIDLSDKLKVREYINQKLGSEHLPDLYATYQNSDEFNLENLPNQFVLKTNHASGSNFINIVKSKKEIEELKIRNWIDWSLKQDYGKITNEWWYNQINPRKVIAEELLNPNSKDLKDYKFLLNNGEILFIQVDQERFTDHKRNIYDKNWNKLNVSFKYPIGELETCPNEFKEMKRIAIELGKDFKIVRVDLYLTEDQRIIFGELTFAPEAGWGKFKPYKFDQEFGKQLMI